MPNGYVLCAFEKKLRRMWRRNPMLVVVMFEQLGLVDVANNLRQKLASVH